ncbi:DUF887 family protein [Schizosaccharomyces japonicus yFS275]|uniref:DUF887 family protein n=1 Tax=Schizosaccharomyces japonicus (strain yFS275 / FY16936) TaxID=402676 RepID=B6JZ86_SCHJY|nr:DUF887 family protein [Schizosaccharomyces japonicus yFS275]EEB06854.1 DUF887 family protein [Schizosaccharomyces japonicus yFS275]
MSGGLFPRAPEAFEAFFEPLFAKLHLSKLARHTHVFIGAALVYQLVMMLSPRISSRLSKHYPSLPLKTRINWDIHFVSTVQSIFLCVVGSLMFVDRRSWSDKIFGYSEFTADVIATAGGYFLWDLLTSIRYVYLTGPGFVVHALAALFVVCFSYRPFLMYFAPTFLSWELSTPFLNVHYFLDKTDRTGSKLQLINGLMLVLTFFLVRIVYGWYSAYDTTLEVIRRVKSTPYILGVFFLIANMSLNFLNLYWLYKMIDAIKRRVDGEKKPKKA